MAGGGARWAALARRVLRVRHVAAAAIGSLAFWRAAADLDLEWVATVALLLALAVGVVALLLALAVGRGGTRSAALLRDRAAHGQAACGGARP